MFSVSALTSKGKIIEVRVFNKGRATEEDVLVALSPDRDYEVLASTDSSSSLDGSSIRIPRIPPGDDCSVLMLVEGGDFTKDEISTVSSKIAKGKFVEGIENVPQNAGSIVLFIAFFLSVLATPVVGVEMYDKWKEGINEREHTERMSSLEFLSDIGWSSLDRYALSKLSENYSQGEFPLFQKELMRKGDVLIIPFTITNKTAAPLRVRAMPEHPYDDRDPRPWENSVLELKSVDPGDSSELLLRVFWPANQRGEFSIDFHLDSGSETFIRLSKSIQVDV